MNLVVLMGRLVRDPETKDANGTQLCKFSIAVDRLKGEADFFNCTAFNKTAEFIGKHFVKGQRILISGRIQNSTYTKKDGSKGYSTDIIVNNAEFADSKKDVQLTEDEFISAAADEGLPFFE